MKNKGSKLVCILVLYVTCKCPRQKTEWEKQRNFTSIEVSFDNGWTGDFSFRVDSSRIYFFIPSFGKVYYGRLPDHLFRLLDSSVAIIRKDTSLKIFSKRCFDCPEIVVKLIADGDTVLIRQGDIKKIFAPMTLEISQYMYGAPKQELSCPDFEYIGEDFETRRMLGLQIRPIKRLSTDKME